jgi:hypothetical protein
MKFATDRPYGDPEKAARRIVEIASTVEPAQDGRSASDGYMRDEVDAMFATVYAAAYLRTLRRRS